MGRNGFLRKDRLEAYLNNLSKKGGLYVPKEEKGAIVFRKYSGVSELSLKKPATTPAKSIIYPQSETFFRFRFEKEGNGLDKVNVRIQESGDQEIRIIFGARPCDAKGFSVIDRVFIDTDTQDVYYKKRRENSYIATKSCDSPSSGCFCISVGGGPFDEEGSDAQFTEINGGYLIEAITEKGNIFLESELIEPGEAYLEEKRKRKEEVERLVKEYCERVGKIEPLSPKLRLFSDEDFWKKHLSKCLSCGVCTYLCPTCYCFNITDEKTFYEGERIRSWDSCMFFHFTLEASGHNPRPDKFKRFRNRVGHKFMFYPERYSGQIACCGCGRCVRFCPVSVDIREIVLELMKSEEGGRE